VKEFVGGGLYGGRRIFGGTLDGEREELAAA
jgi:hypothetical protein